MGITGKAKVTPEHFNELCLQFLQDVVKMEDIPPQLVLNWDQTGLNLVPASSTWIMEHCGTKRVQINGLNDKRRSPEYSVVIYIWW